MGVSCYHLSNARYAELLYKIYILCRLMALSFVITNLVGLNVTTAIDCNVRRSLPYVKMYFSIYLLITF